MMEMLGPLMGPELKRRLEMRKLTPDQVWEGYLQKVRLEHREEVLQEYLRILGLFRSFLGSECPTTERARGYLQQFADRSRNTQARYTDIINGVLGWCGEEKVTRVRTPKRQPRYIPETEFDGFFARMGNKKSHKGTIERDTLMFELMDATGMRCIEVSDDKLKVNDLFLDGPHRKAPYVIAHGKGDKDRTIPLTLEMADRLRSFVKGKRLDESVFGLKRKTVVNKFWVWKNKADVSLTAHDLRRHFATNLHDAGVRTRITQDLLGHESIATTERYIAIPPDASREAIELRQRRRNSVSAAKEESPQSTPATAAIPARSDGEPDLLTALRPANLAQVLDPGADRDIDTLAPLPRKAAKRKPPPTRST